MTFNQLTKTKKEKQNVKIKKLFALFHWQVQFELELIGNALKHFEQIISFD